MPLCRHSWRSPLRLLFLLLVAILFSTCTYTDLPHVHITTDTAIDFDKKRPARIAYTDGGNETQLEGKIKARGGYSRKFAKRSYALELDAPFTLGGLPADDDWVLNASYIDKTFMRHRLSFDLFGQMSSRNIAPQCSYLTVTANDVEQGLYVAMQKVNAGLTRRYYEGDLVGLWKEPPVFYKDKLSSPQEPDNYYQQKYPKIKRENRSADMDSLHRFLHYGSDSLFVENVATFFDVDQIIDWHLLLLLSNNSDGLLKNFYLYKIEGTSGYRIAVWDYDHSFGRDGDNELNMMDRPINTDRCVLLRRLGTTYPEYKDRLRRRYTYLRQTSIWSAARFFSMIDDYDAEIARSVRANQQLWPIDSEDYFDDSDYAAEVDLIRKYVPLRLAQLDDQFGYTIGD